MTFDATITLGQLMQTLALLGGLIVAYVKIRERLVAIETKLGPMWTWWAESRLEERAEWQKHVEAKIEHAVRGAVQAALWQSRLDARRDANP